VVLSQNHINRKINPLINPQSEILIHLPDPPYPPDPSTYQTNQSHMFYM